MGSSELACVYAALVLADDEIDITGEKIATILKAAKVTVEPFWPGLFAKALSGCDVGSHHHRRIRRWFRPSRRWRRCPCRRRCCCSRRRREERGEEGRVRGGG